MSDGPSKDSIGLSAELQIDALCDEFEHALGCEPQPLIESFLTQIEPAHHPVALRELLMLEVEFLRRHELPVNSEDYRARFAGFTNVVHPVLDELGLGLPDSRKSTRSFDLEQTDGAIAQAFDANLEEVAPQRFGRYEVRRKLGGGAFGRVYLAHDAQLDRLVAIKVPSQRLLGTGKSVDVFLEEARNACKLRHPRVVAVHDVQIENEQPYVVQDYVEGLNLADWMEAQTQSIPPEQTVAMLIDVAEALAAAHAAGLVHRDLKPANILLDSECRPHVADFGLALHESAQRHRKGEVSGTPAYMSPEQVRGESHLLDGRTDLWSLGVVLYEMLVGRRPFGGDSRDELNAEILERDPKPPSMVRPSARIDAELERICLKCLRKRASDRYASASRLIDDLRHWLEISQQTAIPTAPANVGQAETQRATQTDNVVRILPKGLRSYDEEDADFFLDLLPGPRDREGLPDTIRFWKSRIEQTDPDETFRVGLIYGPSGCGKSSFVKAGLIPHLDHDHVLPICIEATPLGTERRLLKAIEKHCPDAKSADGLADAVRWLRDRKPHQPKVLFVIDQFEQWLYTHRKTSSSVLINALRQCDGGQVQCILMVRDDFWMAISRFMNNLEVPILEGRNSAAVDLFDLPHAHKVLMALGRAFDRLPQAEDLTSEQSQFIEQAVTELSEEEKVVCVRLSLFADMLKGRPWTPAELKQVGGTKGVGATFLEETFSATTAPPQHRLHQKAARAVLATLLPDAGTEIKGHMRSRAELIAAAGYEHRAKEFDQLLAILDRDLRLITPTDLDAVEEDTDNSVRHSSETDRETYYQLTHDYLVPSLREWLTRKQKETRRGRAELQLADRAMLWNNKPESKQLPGLWEYLGVRTLTDSRKWTSAQRKMMTTAGRRHTIRATTAVVLLAVAMWAGWRVSARVQARSLLNQLATAKPSEVLPIADRLQSHLVVASPWLQRDIDQTVETDRQRQQQMHARIALVASDDTQVKPLIESLLTEQPAYIGVIRDALRPHQSAVAASLWEVLTAESEPAGRRFRAALALADYDPDSNGWAPETTAFVASQLVDFNPEHQPTLREYLRPIRGRMLDDLARIYRQPDATETQLVASASALADIIDDDDVRLADLLISGTPKQYDIVWPRLVNSTNPDLLQFLDELVRQQPADDLGSLDRVTLGRRRAGAAITRMRQGAREEILPIFEFTDDPEAMTQFIHRCKARGVRAEEVLELLELVRAPASATAPSPPIAALHSDSSPIGGEGRGEGPLTPAPPALFPAGSSSGLLASNKRGRESGGHARYALLLALGEFNLTDIPEADRESLIDRLAHWYRDDPSSGIHGASGWLLRQWGYDDIVREVDKTPVPYSPDREWFTLAIKVTSPYRQNSSPDAEAADETTDAEANASTPGEPSGESGGDENGENQDGENADSSAPVDETAAPQNDEEANQDTREGSDNAEEENKANRQPAYEPQTLYFTFVVFQPGEYRIGSVDDEGERYTAADGIQHVARITRPFAMLNREVTFRELIAFDPQVFAAAMNHPGVKAQPTDAGSTPSWFQSVDFCRWLTEQAGMPETEQCYASRELLEKDKDGNPENWPVDVSKAGFRLLTAAEWEIACSSGMRTAYGQGSDVDLLGHYAWFTENSAKHVHPPGARRPGVRGLFDMHGNLYEWCHDWFGGFTGQGVDDWTGPDQGSSRVYRGGGWDYDAGYCRSSKRFFFGPAVRGRSLGFRLAHSPSSEAAERGD